MRNRGFQPLSILLIVAVVFASVYFYRTVSARCNIPVVYHVGDIASQFDLSPQEARAVLSEAEAVWEDATGLNLFTYEDNEGLPVNFIYDERQAETNAEMVLREQLEERQHLSEEISEEHEQLLEQYQELEELYEEKVAAYESRLDAHNAEVEHWNDEGGAPEDVYEKLQEQQRTLGREQRTINDLADQLNRLAKEINNLGERGNVIVSAYNNVVNVYNNRFNQEREFTQGDYQGTSINIYQYESREELVTVLTHELGHALSLDHVEKAESFMYFLMGEQSLEAGLTPEDIAEFEAVCNPGSGGPSSWW